MPPGLTRRRRRDVDRGHRVKNDPAMVEIALNAAPKCSARILPSKRGPPQAARAPLRLQTSFRGVSFSSTAATQAMADHT